MGQDRRRIFLKIIGRQPVIFGANKGFKETPGAACDLPRKLRVVVTQEHAFRRPQGADPMSDER